MTGILLLGAVVGVLHFAVIGALYGNPLVDRLYAHAMASEPSVRRWESKARYLVTQFLGTQVEVYLLTAAFVVMRAAVPSGGLPGAVMLGALLGAGRVYPRFWNMWIQTTYPRRLLVIELVNGFVGTLSIAVGLELLMRWLKG